MFKFAKLKSFRVHSFKDPNFISSKIHIYIYFKIRQIWKIAIWFLHESSFTHLPMRSIPKTLVHIDPNVIAFQSRMTKSVKFFERTSSSCFRVRKIAKSESALRIQFRSLVGEINQFYSKKNLKKDRIAIISPRVDPFAKSSTDLNSQLSQACSAMQA